MASPASVRFKMKLLGNSPQANDRYLNDALYHASVEMAAFVLDIVNYHVPPELCAPIADDVAASFQPLAGT